MIKCKEKNEIEENVIFLLLILLYLSDLSKSIR